MNMGCILTLPYPNPEMHLGHVRDSNPVHLHFKCILILPYPYPAHTRMHFHTETKGTHEDTFGRSVVHELGEHELVQVVAAFARAPARRHTQRGVEP